ncbi:hypothetical protein Tco_1401729 [Tanacetum coccineum]
MENRENGRILLNSVQNGPLICPTVIEADGTTRTKKYEELSTTKKIQADCDCKSTNIILQEFPQLDLSLAVLVFNQGDDPIAYLNKAMAFLTAIASSRGSKDRVMLTEDLDGYDSDCDDVSNAKAILMAKLSSYGFDVLLEIFD